MRRSQHRTLYSVALFLCALSVFARSQTEDFAAQSHQAKELMTEGRFEEAIPIYQHLVQALPGNHGFVLNLGLAEEMAGHPDQAILQFRAVLKVQPDNLPALTSLANAELELKRFDAAAREYRKLTSLDASDARSWYGLGKAYESLAADAFDRLAKGAPQSPYIAALLADTRLQRKQFRSAFFFYQQAQAKLPNLPGVHAGLAKVYEQTGHADWAAEEQKKERSLSPPNCKVQTSECRLMAGDLLGATKAGAAERTPASLFWATKAFNQLAFEAFDHLGALPESAEIHVLKAQILQDRGQGQEAATEWRAALALSPGDRRLENELAASLFLARRYDELVPMLEKMLRDEPASADLNFMMGDSLLQLQKPEQARPYLAAALKANPKMLSAHAALGMALGLLNQNTDAIPHLEKALALDEDGSLHYSLARAYQAAGDTEHARQTLQQYQQIRQKNEEASNELAKESEITAPAPPH